MIAIRGSLEAFRVWRLVVAFFTGRAHLNRLCWCEFDESIGNQIG